MSFWLRKNHSWFTQATVETTGRKQCWFLASELIKHITHTNLFQWEQYFYCLLFRNLPCSSSLLWELVAKGFFFSKHHSLVCLLSALLLILWPGVLFCKNNLFLFVILISIICFNATFSPHSHHLFLFSWFPFLYSPFSLHSLSDYGITSHPTNNSKVS